MRRTDLILVLWPIFFVAATRQDPHLKPRDFRRSAETVAGVTGFTGVTATLAGPLKRTMARGDRGGREIDVDATDRQIERPYWEDTPSDTPPVEQLVSGLKGLDMTCLGRKRRRVPSVLKLSGPLPSLPMFHFSPAQCRNMPDAVGCMTWISVESHACLVFLLLRFLGPLSAGCLILARSCLRPVYHWSALAHVGLGTRWTPGLVCLDPPSRKTMGRAPHLISP